MNKKTLRLTVVNSQTDRPIGEPLSVPVEWEHPRTDAQIKKFLSNESLGYTQRECARIGLDNVEFERRWVDEGDGLSPVPALQFHQFIDGATHFYYYVCVAKEGTSSPIKGSTVLARSRLHAVEIFLKMNRDNTDIARDPSHRFYVIDLNESVPFFVRVVPEQFIVE